MPERLPIKLPGSPYFTAGTSIARMLGVDIPGPMDAVSKIPGVSSMFGGGRSVRPGYGGIDTSLFNDTYMQDFNMDGFQNVSGRSYRQGAGPLADTGRFIANLSTRERGVLSSLGLNDLAGGLKKALTLGTPLSQADQRNKQNQSLGYIANAMKIRTGMFDTISSDPNASAQFENQTGISIDNFTKEMKRQDDVWRKQTYGLPKSEAAIAKAKKAASGFTTVYSGRSGRGGGGGNKRDTGQVARTVGGLGRNQSTREIIGRGELDSREANLLSKINIGEGIRNFINTPGLNDISGIMSQFGGFLDNYKDSQVPGRGGSGEGSGEDGRGGGGRLRLPTPRISGKPFEPSAPDLSTRGIELGLPTPFDTESGVPEIGKTQTPGGTFAHRERSLQLPSKRKKESLNYSSLTLS